MRKILLLIAVLLIAIIAYIGYAHFSGGAVPTFGLPIGGHKVKVRERVKVFFEHVKFKNERELKNLVRADAEHQEVASYLTKTLGIDVDQVDLDSVTIDQIELNSPSTRARVKVRLTGLNLVNRAALNINKIIFLYRSSDDRWLIDIASLSP